MGQQSRFTLAGWFCSKVSYKPAVKKSTRASVSLDGLTGEGSASKITHKLLSGFNFS